MEITDNKEVSEQQQQQEISIVDGVEKESEERERHARELKAGLHPLRNKFVFWYTRRTPGVRTQTSYEDNIKKIVEFSTVEAFWVCYCHLARPSSLPSPNDLHLFKEGIRPLWEDSANCNGGKWIIRFKKAVSGRFWEDLVLALVGDQLDYGDNICGAVLSIRFNEDILSVWNRNASDHQAVMALRDAIKHQLKLPNSYVMEYKAHNASLRDNSSYRNTWLRGLNTQKLMDMSERRKIHHPTRDGGKGSSVARVKVIGDPEYDKEGCCLRVRGRNTSSDAHVAT
ncbi:Eukaryotic translation initiation factor 4e, partial [Thalictrum thalictroides]